MDIGFNLLNWRDATGSGEAGARAERLDPELEQGIYREFAHEFAGSFAQPLDWPALVSRIAAARAAALEIVNTQPGLAEGERGSFDPAGARRIARFSAGAEVPTTIQPVWPEITSSRGVNPNDSTDRKASGSIEAECDRAEIGGGEG
jgi:hypothetical protein